jgi:hypothetical protein
MNKATQHKEDEFTLKEKILYALGSVVVLGGSFFLGRKLVLKGISNKEEKKTFDEGSSATYAKQIKMAFDNDGWWGTDTEKLRSTMREIPTKDDVYKVANSYQKLYNSNMMKDMSDELQSTEYNEMLSIIANKPDKKGKIIDLTKQYPEWAKRLKAAFDKTYGPFPGTDEDAIKAVFLEMPTQTSFINVGKAYYKLYSANLIDDLRSEISDSLYYEDMAIITSKPKA